MPQLQAIRQKTSAVSNNYEAGGVAIVCTKPVKKSCVPNERTSRKGVRSDRANSSPACCRERCENPPEYTVFECRIDGNRPIAQVVHVQSDTTDSALENKTCMLLETKQSEYGPTSRIAAYPAEASSRTSQKRPRPTGAMSFALESRDGPGGAVACAGKFAEHMDERSAISFAQPVTTLETTKGPACPSGPSARLVYGPVPEAVVKTSGTRGTPAFHIQCSTTPEGPIARVTQIPRELTKSAGDPGTCYETFVKHDGSCPTAMVTRSNGNDECQNACGFLETWVDSSGPRARARALPEELSNVRHFTHLQVHSKEPDSKNQKQEHNSHPEKEHGAVSSSKNNKKVVDEKEKLEKIIRDSPDGKKAKIKLRAVKSRELLAGVVYYDCDCYHRNGLQQDCPRGECRGTKRCLAKPWPDCDMARYFRWKWGRYYRLLDLIPPTTFCGPRDVLFQAKVGRENVPKVEKKCEKLGKPSGVETNAKSGEKKAVPPKERHQRKCRDLENYHTCQKYALIPVVVDDSHDR